jgi:hypothetical protein
VNARVTLTTELLERVVAEWMAERAGVPMPVQHTARWGWVPGKGPVLLEMVVESVPNVAPLRRGQSGG